MTSVGHERSEVLSYWLIDQLNGDWAKLISCDQDDLSIELPIALLPSTVNEGQIFQMNLQYDPEVTQQEQSILAQQVNDLSATDDGGDFSL
ncbi:MAG: hypothetical protein CMH49_10150 [Myxococcales bacterium]|nr:hypothetical protein [Myxococcales bacterium]